MPTSYAKAVDPKTGALSSWIVKQRIYKHSVHHPKYMILFEKDGSVVVVVSTSNLTSSQSTEGSWIQRFPPTVADAAASSSGTKPTGSSDFGKVLANFLQCQMLVTAEGQLTANAFVQRYLSWKSLVSLEHLFDYSRAQVHSIATVPGDPEGRHSTLHCWQQQQQNKNETSNSNNLFYYGPQRVADVLVRRKIPPTLEDDCDRLIFQPTSFGGDWDSCSMSAIVRLYLGYDDPSDSPVGDHDVLQRLDIVWPTDYFIRQASQMVRDSSKGSPTTVVTAPDFSLGFASFAESVRDKKMLETDMENGGKLFFFIGSIQPFTVGLSCPHGYV